jgi:hypothetical protein
MADNLTEPRLVVNTQARVAGQPSPAMSQSITGSYAAGQTLNQTLVLRSGQSYSPGLGFTNLVITTTGPIQLLAARGENATFINQVVNQQTTIDDSADSFTVTNNGTTSVTVKMLIQVGPGEVTTPTGVVTSLDGMIGNINIVAGPGISVVNGSQSITINNTGVYTVNGQSGNVSIDANNLSGLAEVAITGKYSDLIGAPSAYTLPVATSTVLGGIKVGEGLSITQDGTLSATGIAEVLTVDSQHPDANGNIVVKAVDNTGAGVSLIKDSGATTGNLIFQKLIPGGNILLMPDTSGENIVITGTVLPYTLPVATNNVLGGVKQGTGVMIASDGTLSVTAQYALPVASATVLGGVKVGTNLSIDANGVLNANTNPYTLPVATTAVLGGVKQGANVYIAVDGTLSVAAPYVLPVATTSVLGGVKQGAGVLIASDGTISATTQYTLPVASATILGGIKVGTNLSIDANGVLSANANAYVLPVATSSVLGGVKQGANVYIAVDGTLSVAAPYVLPKATTTALGGIIVGDNLTIDSNGRLSAIQNLYSLPAATVNTLGGVIVGSGLSVDNTGKLSVSYTAPVTSVSGQVGAVVVKAQSANPETGSLSIVADSGAATGVITTHDLMAGPGTTIVPDTAGNLVISSTGLVSSVSEQKGNVTIQAIDKDNSTGVSLIYDSGATTGTIKLLRLVAGNNVAITPDSKGNLQIGLTGVPIPIATYTTLGAVKIGSNLTITPDGTLSGVAQYVLPVATASLLGGVKQGAGVTIAGDGTISMTGVTSVSGQTGAVVVSATDNNPATGNTLITNNGETTGNIKLRTLVAGSNISITTDAFNNLVISGTPASYTLPVATTTVLGGVKQGAGVSIAGDGTISVTALGGVTSVSGQTGAVVVQAQNVSTASGVTLVGDSGATTGIIKIKQIVAGSGITVANDANGNLEISGAGSSYVLPVATTSVLGGVKQGSGVTIAGDGTLSVTGAVTSVSGQTGAVTVLASDNNAASGTSLIANSGAATADIKLRTLVAGTNVTITSDANSNLVINSSGSSSYTLPVATASVLGGVKQGSGVTIAGDGTLSVTGSVTSVSGQTGAVVVQAADVSTASGVTLIGNSGATTGSILVKRIVAGAGVSVANDSNGNLQVSATLPIASATVLGGVKQGSGVAIAGDGTLSVTSTGVTTFNGRNGAVTLTSSDVSLAGGATAADIAAAKYYDLQGGASGALVASQILMQHVAVRALTVPASMAGSAGYASVAPTGAVSLAVSVLTPGGSSTNVGTINWAVGASTPTFAGSGFSVAVGQVVIVTAPGTADATFANASFTILTLAT